jgi:hypothetical protein
VGKFGIRVKSVIRPSAACGAGNKLEARKKAETSDERHGDASGTGAAAGRECPAQNQGQGAISLKVSEKGAVSLYGMGRFPVTLYKEQWPRILTSAPLIETFIRENEAELKTKE